jgi:hypothetical protein
MRAPVTPGREATFFSNFAAQSSQVMPSTTSVVCWVSAWELLISDSKPL